MSVRVLFLLYQLLVRLRGGSFRGASSDERRGQHGEPCLPQPFRRSGRIHRMHGDSSEGLHIHISWRAQKRGHGGFGVFLFLSGLPAFGLPWGGV